MKVRSRRGKECGQKLCHPDYLSAMCHANKLINNEGIHIYPCSYCNFLHIGHSGRAKKFKPVIPALEGIDQPPQTGNAKPPVREQSIQGKQPKRVHDLAWQLARMKRRVALEESQIARFFNPRPKTIRRHQRRLRDMRRHLAWLENQALRPQIIQNLDTAQPTEPEAQT